MKTTRLILGALALALVGAVNAQGAHRSPTKPAKAVSDPVLPLVNADVREVDLENGLVVLRHDAIPSIAMDAMTMEFDVADKKMLVGVKVGDRVQFQAEMVNGKATVTELKR